MPLILLSNEPSHDSLVRELLPVLTSLQMDYEVLPASEAEWKFKDNECDVALVSPLVYAQNETEFAVLEGVVVAAVGPTNDTHLCFKAGLHHFNTIGCGDSASVDAMLAQIILRERYDMRPVFHTFSGSVIEGLQRFDAVLVHGTTGTLPDKHCIDIVDEWFDLTQLPYVRGLVAGWKHRTTIQIAEAVQRAGRALDAREMRSMEARLDGHFSDDATQSIPGHYRYVFDADCREGLDVFFRYAFYHGLHRDIPTISFWAPDEERE